SRRGRRQVAAASQEERCAKGPAVIEVAKEATQAFSTIDEGFAMDLPSPSEIKRAEGDAAALGSATEQDGTSSGVLVELDEGSRVCRLSNEFELLSPSEGSIAKTPGTSGACEDIPLDLPSPRETNHGKESAGAVGSGEEKDGAGVVPVESKEGSTACRLSNAVELLSPSQSSIGKNSEPLAACVVRFPLELEEELRARIANRG
ncbi:unnamed protein product, partial [Laminaria digitata]